MGFMRFQTRVLFTYSVLILLLVVTLGIAFFLYTSRLFEQNARANYSLVVDNLVEQFDNQFRSMEFLETNLISDSQFKSSLDTLGSVDRSNPLNGVDLNDAVTYLRASVVSYSAIKNFYAVNLFNHKGDFFSSNFLDHASVTGVTDTIARLPWADRVVALSGKRLLLAPYPDPWSRSGRLVYGLVRYMPGSRGDLGFIEVQNDYASLRKLFRFPDPQFTRVSAWTESGELFYRSDSLSATEAALYHDRTTELEGTAFFPTPGTGRDELVLRQRSSETGLTLVLALDRTVLVAPLWVTAGLTVWIGFMILLVSMAYNWYSSRQLTQPLRLISKRMEATELEDLPHTQPLDHPNDEIMALNDAFQRLKERLDDAIRDEIRTRTLGVQTQLDSLQAQVNPHFLYNILTVLANKGLEVGDREIGEICGGIASMLRYSTSTAERSATLGDELEHMETYLGLMKKRFEDRLTYTIAVEPALLTATLPKIVLQQIVENSINHGFRTVARPMVLSLRGWAEDGRWVLEFTDNGQGFEPAVLEAQTNALAETSRRLHEGAWTEGLSIGGLGLRNTYGRLFLYFSGQVGWTMENRPEGGARVTISAPLVVKEGQHA
jgi:two-component system sensor histidine kinase YesM